MSPAIDVKRLSVWYEEKNDVWKRYKKFFGFYSIEKSLVNGKPSYISEKPKGAYAVWFTGDHWCLGPSSNREKDNLQCAIFAEGKVHSGFNDDDPTDSYYTWEYYGSNGASILANLGFKINSADGNSTIMFLLNTKISMILMNMSSREHYSFLKNRSDFAVKQFVM